MKNLSECSSKKRILGRKINNKIKISKNSASKNFYKYPAFAEYNMGGFMKDQRDRHSIRSSSKKSIRGGAISSRGGSRYASTRKRRLLNDESTSKFSLSVKSSANQNSNSSGSFTNLYFDTEASAYRSSNSRSLIREYKQKLQNKKLAEKMGTGRNMSSQKRSAAKKRHKKRQKSMINENSTHFQGSATKPKGSQKKRSRHRREATQRKEAPKNPPQKLKTASKGLKIGSKKFKDLTSTEKKKRGLRKKILQSKSKPALGGAKKATKTLKKRQKSKIDKKILDRKKALKFYFEPKKGIPSTSRGLGVSKATFFGQNLGSKMKKKNFVSKHISLKTNLLDDKSRQQRLKLAPKTKQLLSKVLPGSSKPSKSKKNQSEKNTKKSASKSQFKLMTPIQKKGASEHKKTSKKRVKSHIDFENFSKNSQKRIFKFSQKTNSEIPPLTERPRGGSGEQSGYHFTRDVGPVGHFTASNHQSGKKADFEDPGVLFRPKSSSKHSEQLTGNRSTPRRSRNATKRSKKSKKSWSKSRSKSRSKSKSKSRSLIRGEAETPIHPKHAPNVSNYDKNGKKSEKKQKSKNREILENKIKTYNHYATKIQKVWRGYKKRSSSTLNLLKNPKTQNLEKSSEDYEEMEPVCIKSTPRQSSISSALIVPRTARNAQNLEIGASFVIREVSGFNNTSRTLLRYGDTLNTQTHQSSHQESHSIVSESGNGDIVSKYLKFTENFAQKWKKFKKYIEKAAYEAQGRNSIVDKCYDFKRRGEMTNKILKEGLMKVKARNRKKRQNGGFGTNGNNSAFSQLMSDERGGSYRQQHDEYSVGGSGVSSGGGRARKAALEGKFRNLAREASGREYGVMSCSDGPGQGPGTSSNKISGGLSKKILGIDYRTKNNRFASVQPSREVNRDTKLANNTPGKLTANPALSHASYETISEKIKKIEKSEKLKKSGSKFVEKWTEPNRKDSVKIISKVISTSKNVLSSLSLKNSFCMNSMSMALSRSKSIQETDLERSRKVERMVEQAEPIQNWRDRKMALADISRSQRAMLGLEQIKSVNDSERLKEELDGIKELTKKSLELKKRSLPVNGGLEGMGGFGGGELGLLLSGAGNAMDDATGGSFESGGVRNRLKIIVQDGFFIQPSNAISKQIGEDESIRTPSAFPRDPSEWLLRDSQAQNPEIKLETSIVNLEPEIEKELEKSDKDNIQDLKEHLREQEDETSPSNQVIIQSKTTTTGPNHSHLPTSSKDDDANVRLEDSSKDMDTDPGAASSVKKKSMGSLTARRAVLLGNQSETKKSRLSSARVGGEASLSLVEMKRHPGVKPPVIRVENGLETAFGFLSENEINMNNPDNLGARDDVDEHREPKYALKIPQTHHESHRLEINVNIEDRDHMRVSVTVTEDAGSKEEVEFVYTEDGGSDDFAYSRSDQKVDILGSGSEKPKGQKMEKEVGSEGKEHPYWLFAGGGGVDERSRNKLMTSWAKKSQEMRELRSKPEKRFELSEKTEEVSEDSREPNSHKIIPEPQKMLDQRSERSQESSPAKETKSGLETVRKVLEDEMEPIEVSDGLENDQKRIVEEYCLTNKSINQMILDRAAEERKRGKNSHINFGKNLKFGQIQISREENSAPNSSRLPVTVERPIKEPGNVFSRTQPLRNRNAQNDEKSENQLQEISLENAEIEKEASNELSSSKKYPKGLELGLNTKFCELVEELHKSPPKRVSPPETSSNAINERGHNPGEGKVVPAKPFGIIFHKKPNTKLDLNLDDLAARSPLFSPSEVETISRFSSCEDQASTERSIKAPVFIKNLNNLAKFEHRKDATGVQARAEADLLARKPVIFDGYPISGRSEKKFVVVPKSELLGIQESPGSSSGGIGQGLGDGGDRSTGEMTQDVQKSIRGLGFGIDSEVDLGKISERRLRRSPKKAEGSDEEVSEGPGSGQNRLIGGDEKDEKSGKNEAAKEILEHDRAIQDHKDHANLPNRENEAKLCQKVIFEAEQKNDSMINSERDSGSEDPDKARRVDEITEYVIETLIVQFISEDFKKKKRDEDSSDDDNGEDNHPNTHQGRPPRPPLPPGHQKPKKSTQNPQPQNTDQNPQNDQNHTQTHNTSTEAQQEGQNPPENPQTTPQQPPFSDLKKIVQYLKYLFREINKRPEEQKKIFRKLNTPIGATNFQKHMLASAAILEEEFEGIGPLKYEPILDISLYISLEEKLRDTLYREKQMGPVEMEREHILHKLIFDSLNEKLDHRRVYGLKGMPMFYSSRVKKERSVRPKDCATTLEQSRQDIIEWAMMRIGNLAENEPMLLQIAEVDALELVREETMIKLLKSYICNLEVKWNEFNDEELEVGILLSEKVFDWLVSRAIDDLIEIRKKRLGRVEEASREGSGALDDSNQAEN